MDTSNVLVGADPELFLFDGDTPHPVIGLLGGTKDEPIPVKNGALQEDNVLAEFNIDPAKSAAQFVHNITSVMDQLAERVKPYQLKAQSSAEFVQQTLMDAGPKAVEFGCNPDFNAWTRRANTTPDPYTTLRTAGGHIHVGVDNLTEDQKFELIKLMDIFLGIPSILIDGDTRRREMYGKAGACRLKPYGVEYRTLSSFWLQSKELTKWAYDNTLLAVGALGTGFLETTTKHNPQDVINRSYQGIAARMVDKYNIPMPETGGN